MASSTPGNVHHLFSSAKLCGSCTLCAPWDSNWRHYGATFSQLKKAKVRYVIKPLHTENVIFLKKSFILSFCSHIRLSNFYLSTVFKKVRFHDKSTYVNERKFRVSIGFTWTILY